jgi:hypothetical protein
VCLRQSRPAALKRSSGEHNEALWHLSRTAALEAKRKLGARLQVRSLGTIIVGGRRGRVPSGWCWYERAWLFACRIGRISPLYRRERGPIHLHPFGFGACLAEPDRRPLLLPFSRMKGSPSHARCRRRGKAVARAHKKHQALRIASVAPRAEAVTYRRSRHLFSCEQRATFVSTGVNHRSRA